MDQVQQELDALAARLGRSLTIDNLNGDLIAYSTQRDDTDQVRISSILHRHVAAEVREWQTRHIAGRTEPVTVPANSELGMSARICVPLRRKGRTLGHLWMLATELTDEEDAAVRRAAEALAAQLSVPTRAGRETDRLVRELLVEDRTEAYNDLALAVPGIVEGTVQVVAAVTAGGVRPFRSEEFAALNGSFLALRATPSYVGAAVSTNYALVVVREEMLDRIDEAISRALDKATLGISDPKPLQEARKSRDQALTAAELASLDPALGRHARWSALGAYREMLETQPDDRVLAPLDKAPMLLETLETYLDLAGDIQAVAARLTLHRSSLYYRLDRIAHLLDADLSSGLTRLELHMALKGRRARRRTLST